MLFDQLKLFQVLEKFVDVFLRNVWVNPFWEDDLEDLVNLMTPDHILFGSDYPHPEGISEPLHWIKNIGSRYSARDVAKMMGENLYGLLGLPLPV